MAKLTKAELAELQDPETWEVKGTIHPPVKSPRAIVSVAFSREDFDKVVNHAKQQGMKTSEFIRRAALEYAIPGQQDVNVSVTGGVYTNHVAVAGPRPKVEVKTPQPSVLTST